MSSEVQPEEGQYVVDRAGAVWLTVMDGGMLTRATASAPVSIGIDTARRQLGPLRILDVTPTAGPGLPAPPWGEAEPTTEALARYLRDLSAEHFEVWLQLTRQSAAQAHDCFVRNHERTIERLERELQTAAARSDRGMFPSLAGASVEELVAEVRRRIEWSPS